MNTLPRYDDALSRVLLAVPVIGQTLVPLHAARGRVLAQDITADRDQPPFDRSAMDGFAVRSERIGTSTTTFRIDGSVPAGASPVHFTTPVPEGCVRRIATGAPLPVGCDATIPIEVARVSSDGLSVTFNVDRAAPWQNIHRRASDASRGDVVLPRGTVLAPAHLGIAAAVGCAELAVARPVRVTILTTGDELRDASVPTDALEPQQVRNSNSPMLAALLESLLPGAGAVVMIQHTPDDAQQTLAAAREALSRSHLVVTTGGVSVGERDALPWAWKQLGLECVLAGAAIQPGKPVLVMRDDNKLVLGLPGNPVSVLCTAHLFLWPVVRRMLGVLPEALPWHDAVLAEDVKASSKREVFRAGATQSDGSVRVIPWHGSGDLVHTAGADVWVRLPLQDEPIIAGTIVRTLAMIR